MTEIASLIEILKEEEEIYAKILNLANKKTEMIAEENIDQIETISREEEEFLKKARLLEYKREDEIVKIEKTLGVEKLTDLSSLLNHVEDKELGNDLKNVQMKFTNTVNELRKVNTINNTLLKDALEYIALSLNLMTDVVADNTYGKDATDDRQTQQKSMFDFKG